MKENFIEFKSINGNRVFVNYLMITHLEELKHNDMTNIYYLGGGENTIDLKIELVVEKLIEIAKNK
jgi:uncharacterized protein YlzI (FlbEa/FlbD family)